MNAKLHTLTRRGYNLGTVRADIQSCSTVSRQQHRDWREGLPILLAQQCLPGLTQYRHHIKKSEELYQAVLDDQQCDLLLSQVPYIDRLSANFESLGSSINEGDDQEIETVLFDAVNDNDILAEDLWMKVSWLSFCQEETSLRFRFSFGVDHVEDVAADKLRQHYAASLAEAIFPESHIITQNEALNTQLKALLRCDLVLFVERIVYFNSLNGGAYLHHDRERGHAGVVYAQLSGSTFWLAMPEQQLVQEITHFIQQCNRDSAWPDTINNAMQNELSQLLISEQQLLRVELNSFANSTLIHLINETKAFVQQLIAHGHGYVLQAGDVLLLPQETASNCCWHSVFNLSDTAGQALSFAVRSA